MLCRLLCRKPWPRGGRGVGHFFTPAARAKTAPRGGNRPSDGGFGHDRLNGGTGADRFYHAGLADHGSDWIQDFSAAEDDRLIFALSGATPEQFAVSYAITPGAGQADVAEAFVTYLPTGQIIWALVEAKARGVTRPLQLALSYDEEIGCTGAPPMIAAMQDLLPKADLALIGEPSNMGVPLTR